ncbi:MAG: hypothetical protein E7D37_09640 [Enterobacter cloacae]|nr:hypothetical protein [Enterobacter cloacae]MDU2521083.1 hypothetical protein [Enterobacter cloacae]MDU2668368.1 hypothetical protein [Enterobacter cloacae]
MAIGNRQIQKESPKEELDRLLDELAFTQEQREFIESMRQEDGDDDNGEST